MKVILILFLKKLSHQLLTLLLSNWQLDPNIIVVNGRWSVPSSFSQQTIKQFEIIQVVVLSEVTKLSD